MQVANGKARVDMLKLKCSLKKQMTAHTMQILNCTVQKVPHHHRTQ